MACLLALVALTSRSFAQVVEELPKPIEDPNQLRITQSIQKSELQMDGEVSCTVQIPSQAQGPLVELGPKDPESVLRRLKAYDHWLKSTVEQWKVAPTNPPNFRTARSYAARQKETQQSLERWSQIEQLASQVFHAARIEFELTPQ